MIANKYPTIGLIEPPATGLYDAEGKNWTSLYRHRSLRFLKLFDQLV